MKQVLIAEDEAAISLWLEDVLAEAGYAIAGSFARRAPAETWLRTNTPDLAVLDAELGDGPCVDLARTLRERGVPVLIFSGQSAHSGLPSDLRSLPWVGKPAKAGDLLAALHTLENG
jgi:DNA-binding response OmpR family regulator